MVKIQCCRCKPEWFVNDYLGITCSWLVYVFIFFAEFVIIGVILLPGFPSSIWSYIHSVFFTGFAFLAAFSHLRAMTTNPGTIPKGNLTVNDFMELGLKVGDEVVQCSRCECIKVDRAHHCSICQRCIRKMDHHCPWINNCVGESNKKYFVLFSFYTMTISVYGMSLAVYFILNSSGKNWKSTFLSAATANILLVFLLFEALLFGLFTMGMFGYQLVSVIRDDAGVRYYVKNQVKVKREGGWREQLEDTFGGKFGITWFSPFSSSSTSQKTLGYTSYDV